MPNAFLNKINPFGLFLMRMGGHEAKQQWPFLSACVVDTQRVGEATVDLSLPFALQ
jgi:hypothetical protein